MTNLRYEFAAAVILMAALVRLQATRVLKRLLLLLLLLPRRLRHQRPKLLRATVDLDFITHREIRFRSGVSLGSVG
jgi:hypothetical protein